VVKPFSAHELAARIDAILRRSGRQPAVLRIGGAEVDFDARELRRAGQTHRLLQKEAELLEFLLRHAGKAFGRGELLREVWGYEETPTTRTIDTHVFQLRQKLEPQPESPVHLLTVRGVGYRLVPQP
jgi:DNA-binding response OmpR family regulator